MTRSLSLLNTESPEAAVRRALARAGLRYTPQRAQVYACLRGTDEHPTAQGIHQALRQGSPAISQATVYKSLEVLVGCGLVIRLAFEEGPIRYDARTEDHGHSRCLRCGLIRDLPDEGIRAIVDAATSGRSFLMTHYRMEITGLCERCLDELPCGRCARAATCGSVGRCAPKPAGAGA